MLVSLSVATDEIKQPICYFGKNRLAVIFVCKEFQGVNMYNIIQQPQDDQPSGNLCSSLPKNSLVTRGLNALLNTMDKRVALIATTQCKSLNSQDNCKNSEVCCRSPVGPSCFPLTDTSAGDKVWCPNGHLCNPK